MIKNIIDMLKLSEHYGQSELIEIAKGKYHLHDSFTEIWKQGIRDLKMKRNGRKKGN